MNIILGSQHGKLKWWLLEERTQ